MAGTEEGSSPQGGRIARSAVIGEGCRIAADVEVGEEARLAAGVRLEARVRIGPGTTIGAGAICGAGARIGVETGRSPGFHRVTDIGAQAVVGPGVVVERGVSIGMGAWVAGRVHVCVDVPPLALIDAAPAGPHGMLDRPAAELTRRTGRMSRPVGPTVAGANLVEFKLWRDTRGDLAVLEFDDTLPFQPRRMFTVSRVPPGEVRGLHAHRSIAQLLVCVRGSLQVLVDDGVRRATLELRHQGKALLVEPRVWGAQLAFSRGAVLIVLASAPYDRADYVQDYSEFLRLTQTSPG